MAIIKINRARSQVQTPRQNNITGAFINPQVATLQGNAFAAIGKAIEITADKTKKTEDQNELQRIITETLPIISGKASAYSSSTNINDAKEYMASMDIKEFEPYLKNASKEVKELFQTHLFKQTVSGYRNLHTGILARHLKETKLNQNNKWNDLTRLMAANDTGTASNAEDEFEASFLDPTVIDKYTPNELKKIKEDKKLQAIQLRFYNRNRNNPVDTLNRGREITKKYGVVEATRILDDAKNVLVSITAERDLDSIRLEKADKDQKIANFTDVLLSIQRDDGSAPSLDYITDLFKADQINSAQRNTLFKIKTEGPIITDPMVLDYINGQLSIAETVEDIDAIDEQVLFTAGFADKLGIESIQNIKHVKTLFTKDRKAFEEHKYYEKMLKTDLGEIDGFGVFKSFGSSEKTDQKKKYNGIERYQSLVRGGMRAEDAYVATVKDFLSKENMPTIYEVAMPRTVKMNVPIKGTDPDTYFKSIEDQMIAAYKVNPKDVQAYTEDFERLDTIRDLFNVRLKAFEIGNTGDKKKSTQELIDLALGSSKAKGGSGDTSG
tara:strand:- start:2740 stop:4398 length:1659 start_codon:yes stop_codon:yes gene_type:complete